MAKTGLIYYNVDTNRYQDRRIKRLKKDFKCDGIAVYDYILCEIYRVEGCFLVWDEDTAFDVSEYFGLKETTVKEIVNYCLSVGLFDADSFTKHDILTSIEIQLSFVKLSMYIPLDKYEKYLLIDTGRIPFCKKNKNARLYQRNAKEWKRISREVFKRDNYTCQYCGIVGGKLEVDHIIAFSKGGNDDMSNLTTSCLKCNRKKKDKSVQEFIKARYNE
jgi:hypothetical protein